MRTTSVTFAVLLLAGSATAQETPQEVTRRTNGEIQFANYPRGSLARGEQGTVGIEVTTDKQGRLRSCAVSKSSGFPALDDATCDLLISHLKMKPWLAPNGGGVVKRQQGQITWALPKDYQGPIAKPAGQIALKTKSADPNRKICPSTDNHWIAHRKYANLPDAGAVAAAIHPCPRGDSGHALKISTGRLRGERSRLTNVR